MVILEKNQTSCFVFLFFVLFLRVNVDPSNEKILALNLKTWPFKCGHCYLRSGLEWCSVRISVCHKEGSRYNSNQLLLLASEIESGSKTAVVTTD